MADAGCARLPYVPQPVDRFGPLDRAGEKAGANLPRLRDLLSPSLHHLASQGIESGDLLLAELQAIPHAEDGLDAGRPADVPRSIHNDRAGPGTPSRTILLCR